MHSLRFGFYSIRWALLFGLLLVGLWLLGGKSELEISLHDLRASPTDQAVRIVQLSDLHLQQFGKNEKAIAETVVALHPNLVVLSGDAIDRSDALPALQSFLQVLDGLAVVAVMGNWEHWSGIDLKMLSAVMTSQPNSHLLLNQSQSFEVNGRVVNVLGLDDYTAGKPDLQMLSVGDRVDTTILLQHSPGFFDEPEVDRRMGKKQFSLCLSGHTHGGQINFWGWAPFRPVGSGQFVAGFYDLPVCRLYVSRGVGTSLLPLRWRARPEVAVFDL